MQRRTNHLDVMHAQQQSLALLPYYELQVQHAVNVPPWAYVRAFVVNTTMIPEAVQQVHGSVRRVLVMPQQQQAYATQAWWGNVNWLCLQPQKVALAYSWVQTGSVLAVELAPASVPRFLPPVQSMHAEGYCLQNTLNGVVLMDKHKKHAPQRFEYAVDGFFFNRHIHASVGHVVLEYCCDADSCKGYYVHLVMDKNTRTWHKQQTYTARNGLFNNFPVFTRCGQYVLFFETDNTFIVEYLNKKHSLLYTQKFNHDIKTCYVLTCGSLFCVIDEVQRVRFWIDPVNKCCMQLHGVDNDSSRALAAARGWNYFGGTTTCLNTFPMSRTGAPRL